MPSTADQAVAAAEAGDFAAAAQLFQELIRASPDTAALHEQLAQCLAELEQYDEACASAERATALAPSWPDAWLTWSRALLNAGRLQDAQCACSKCLQLGPGNAEAAHDLATINQLLQQQASLLVGLPGLAIAADPLAQTGPGCVIWQAGMLLAKAFVQLAAMQQGRGPAVAGWERVPRLQGSRVLEMGAGTGIAGITAAACGADATLTDVPQAMELLQSNIARNQQLIAASGGRATHAVLDWASKQASVREQLEQLQHQEWDWACGGDLVFNASQVRPVAEAIAQFLRLGDDRPSRCFLLAHKQRHADVDAQLLQALGAAGCVVTQVQVVGDSVGGVGGEEEDGGGARQSCVLLFLITLNERAADAPPEL